MPNEILKEINEILKEIFELVLAINEEGKYQVFLDLLPHVSKIGLRVYKGGWRREYPDINLECYYDEREDSEEELSIIKNELIELLEEEI